MQRFYDYLRRHPTRVDSLCAVVLLGISGLWIVSGDIDSARARTAAVPIACALSVVVALRRRAPERMLLLAILAGLAQLGSDVAYNGSGAGGRRRGVRAAGRRGPV